MDNQDDDLQAMSRDDLEDLGESMAADWDAGSVQGDALRELPSLACDLALEMGWTNRDLKRCYPGIVSLIERHRARLRS